MRIETDGQTGTITIHPEEGKHSASIVLMHGLGDSGEGINGLAQELNRSFPYIKFIVPTAPQRSVTISGGMPMNAWYDITGLTDRASESCEGIEDTVSRVRSLLQAENALGVAYNRMALAGFSQGGATSLFAGLQLPLDMKLAGILVMSGYLPGASKFKITPGFEDVPVMHCHGTADPVVIFDHVEKTRNHVTEKGLKSYNVRSYNGVGHTITPEILKDVAIFFKQILPFNIDLCIKPKLPKEMSVRELKEAIQKAGIRGQSLGFMEKYEFVRLLEEHQKSKI
eukprot:CAMPEP_0119038956 /NCGR_PEP_ID=MMETSP1177-20130426/8175_1 /TAXON_ID=2985 /ORGANISM="Ochromonas sp, Strain CCMP1899" /LENGTH=282 /DNA_ID=CAMNT_0007002205 /DNA_START=276 /DNA_END=1124 /DNA_ORIENTATION=-